MFYGLTNTSFDSCCCKDCGTTNEEDFQDCVTDDWCDDCFDKSYDEWVEQDKKRNA